MSRPKKVKPADAACQVESELERAIEFLASEDGLGWLREMCAHARAYEALLRLLEVPGMTSKVKVKMLKTHFRQITRGRQAYPEYVAMNLSQRDLEMLIAPLHSFIAGEALEPGCSVFEALSRVSSSAFNDEDVQFASIVLRVYVDHERTGRPVRRLVCEHFPDEWKERGGRGRPALMAKVERIIKEFREMDSRHRNSGEQGR